VPGYPQESARGKYLKFVRSLLDKKSPEDYLSGSLSDGSIHYWHHKQREGLSDQEIEFQKKLMDAGLDWILEMSIVRGQNFTMVISKPKFSQIKRVAAAWAGYIKEVRRPDNYRWIVELQNGRFMYIKAFFDASGFYSNIRLFIRSANTPEKAALFEIRPKTLVRMNKDQDVYRSLFDQIKSGKRDWAGFKWDTEYQARFE
jgi:hypothetical protein